MEASLKTIVCISILLRMSVCCTLKLNAIFLGNDLLWKEFVGKDDHSALAAFSDCLFQLLLEKGL